MRKVEKWVLGLFVASILVDNINGILLNMHIELPLSVGAVYRLIIYIVCGVIIARDIWKKRKSNNEVRFGKKIIVLLAVWLIVLCSLFEIIYPFNISSFLENILYASKLLYPIVIICVLNILSDRRQIKLSSVERVFYWYAIISPITLILPTILGIGFDSYSTGGAKGFYFANNEINIVLICTTLYAASRFLKKMTLSSFVIFIINITAVILIGSKTSIMSIIGVSVFYLFKLLKRKRKNTPVFIGLIVAFVVLSALIFRDTLKQFYVRNVYLYGLLTENGTFLDFLTSSRTQRIVPIFEKNIIDGDLGIVKFFTGIGRSHQVDEKNLYTLTEMDFFDTFFWYGIITAIIVFYYYIRIFVRYLKNGGDIVYKFMFVVVLLFSLIAGHVWFSALAGEMFALICFIQSFNNNGVVSSKKEAMTNEKQN